MEEVRENLGLEAMSQTAVLGTGSKDFPLMRWEASERQEMQRYLPWKGDLVPQRAGLSVEEGQWLGQE